MMLSMIQVKSQELDPNCPYSLYGSSLSQPDMTTGCSEPFRIKITDSSGADCYLSLGDAVLGLGPQESADEVDLFYDCNSVGAQFEVSATTNGYSILSVDSGYTIQADAVVDEVKADLVIDASDPDSSAFAFADNSISLVDFTSCLFTYDPRAASFVPLTQHSHGNAETQGYAAKLNCRGNGQSVEFEYRATNPACTNALEPYNVQFTIDESGSINDAGATNYDSMLSFVRNLIVNDVNDQSKVAALAFAGPSNMDVIYSFTDEQSDGRAAVIDALETEKTDYADGATDIYGAVLAAVAQFQADSTVVDNRVLFLITDGEPACTSCEKSICTSTTNANTLKTALSDESITLYILAIGGFDETEVSCLVSDESHIYRMVDFSSAEFKRIEDEFRYIVCPVTPSPTDVTSAPTAAPTPQPTPQPTGQPTPGPTTSAFSFGFKTGSNTDDKSWNSLNVVLSYDSDIFQCTIKPNQLNTEFVCSADSAYIGRAAQCGVTDEFMYISNDKADLARPVEIIVRDAAGLDLVAGTLATQPCIKTADTGACVANAKIAIPSLSVTTDIAEDLDQVCYQLTTANSCSGSNGNPRAYLSGGTLEDCKRECMELADCSAFVLNVNTGDCSFHAGTLTMTADSIRNCYKRITSVLAAAKHVQEPEIQYIYQDEPRDIAKIVNHHDNEVPVATGYYSQYDAVLLIALVASCGLLLICGVVCCCNAFLFETSAVAAPVKKYLSVRQYFDEEDV